MVAKLNDFNTAVRLHQVITKIIDRQLKKLRPLPRYGTVTGAVNPTTQKVLVQIGRDTNSIAIPCSPWMTPTVGSYVRIEGPDSDLFITHVLKGGIVPGP